MVTSPCYGNRLADHHEARDGSTRRSYTHDLQRMTEDPQRAVHPDNAGRLQWGPSYRRFHVRAWGEVYRVLRTSGVFVLNVSDHVRRGAVTPVTDWHLQCLGELGMTVEERVEVGTPRLRYGANSRARVGYETVALLTNRGYSRS